MINVIGSKYHGDYRIMVWFNAGAECRILDFEPILRKSENPDVRELLDKEKFKQFHIEHGGLCWDNNALSLSARSLWFGDYLRKE